MAASSERLPWLHDEPPAAAGAAARKAPTGSLWPWYLLLLLLVAAVAAGAWWLSTGKDAPPPVLPVEESIPIPVTREAPGVDAQEVHTGDLSPAESASQPAPLRREREARPIQRQAEPPPARVTTDETSSAGRFIFPADEPAVAAPAVPSPAVLANPRPYGGRVVQLGAFPTRPQAEDSWKRITRRYPYLATKPKMVNSVYVRGLGGGRPTRMYRLQLGTSSQAQSVVICQQLERAGHSCVVVY